MEDTFNPQRYENMPYRRCGSSGLKLPAVSLGCWHNFGADDDPEEARAILRRAFDLGITHYDLANNYGPPPGMAEYFFGRFLREEFAAHRDELVISTKAGYFMWSGPYGNGGSRKHLLSSLEQSLRRMNVEYVDVFYHHRPDPETELEETMGALAHAVKSGKALYAGISNYGEEQTRKACKIMAEHKVPLVLNQCKYSLLTRGVEEGTLEACANEGVGLISFSPLEQGLLTSRYLKGIPTDSRAAKSGPFLTPERITEDLQNKLDRLNGIAQERDQSLASMSLQWVLRDPRVTSVIVGASKVRQLEENVKAVQAAGEFTDEQLVNIDRIVENDQQ
jgi:L-glyceraldehyde 3-phosphate reductase